MASTTTQSRGCRKQAHPAPSIMASAANREYRKPTHPGGNTTTPAFLSNLGKATLRGIRRCPQCGIYNGTRGLSCKNKACGVVLRDGRSSAGGRANRKSSIDVVKVVIDGGGGGDGEETAAHSGSGPGGVQVYSVVQAGGRGSSGPQMGFVELVPTDTAIATGDGATLLTRINLGRCFLPSCRQGQNSAQRGRSHASSTAPPTTTTPRSHTAPSPPRGHAPSPPDDGVCAHIRRATECQSHATPLSVKSSVLDALQVSLETRAELWRLATESSGPLVQRVDKDTLVVKCHADSDHPLGLLHVTTGGRAAQTPPEEEEASRAGEEADNNNSNNNSNNNKGPELTRIQQAGFHCTCQVDTRRGKPSPDDGTGQPAVSRRRAAAAAGSNPTPGASAPEPCLHFYACVCAFASEDKLDFDCSGLINYNFNDVHQSSGSRLLSAPDKIQQQLSGLSEDLQHHSKRYCMDHSVTASSVVLPVGVAQEVTSLPVGLGSEVMSLPVGFGSEVTSLPGLRKAVQRRAPHPHPVVMKSPAGGSSQPVEEHSVSMGFHQWLASVTERIHHTMNYQFDGKPEALVYHIPQEFFNALQHRLSLGSKKRRLPNTTTAFVRNDSLPLGSFSKYTWNITNLMQVKRILDTPQMPLELTQSFVKNMDGSYSPFHRPDCPPTDPQRPDCPTDPQPDGSRTDRPLAIRPMELRTFLKVGALAAADQKEATPFVIEWIPDVLPRSRVGELRIRFEFGHEQSGGPPEHGGGGGGGGAASNRRRNGAASSSNTKTPPVVSIQPPHSQPGDVLQIVL